VNVDYSFKLIRLDNNKAIQSTTTVKIKLSLKQIAVLEFLLGIDGLVLFGRGTKCNPYSLSFIQSFVRAFDENVVPKNGKCSEEVVVDEKDDKLDKFLRYIKNVFSSKLGSRNTWDVQIGKINELLC
jgi:hypothetical protein